MRPKFSEPYILGCVSFIALNLLTQVLWPFKFPQCKSWRSILLARAAISDFLRFSQFSQTKIYLLVGFMGQSLICN